MGLERSVPGTPVITSAGLGKSFGETVALDGVSITVAAGGLGLRLATRRATARR